MIQILSSDSPDSLFFEKVTYGYTAARGEVQRPADTNSHMVLSRGHNHSLAYFVGPWSNSTKLCYEPDSEIIWIRLKLGTHIKRVPTVSFLNTEKILNTSFNSELKIGNRTFTIPSHSDIDIFLEQLEKSRIFEYDPIIEESMKGILPVMPERSLRYRFLSSTGLSSQSIFQIQRAHQARQLILEGHKPVDVAMDLGYYDQPHLTRSLRKYLGFTPGSLKV